MKTTRNIALWVLYDFANSIISIVFFMYFAQWVVIDRGLPDFYFNLTFTLSTVLLLFTVPITGSILGRHLRRITGLRYSTAFSALFFGSCALAAIYNFDLSALVLYTLGLYVYQLSFTFYTPLINDIARPERLGLVSGLGITANYLGQFAGLVLVLPFANGAWHFFAGNPRAETLLPAVIAFLVLALPMLFFFREPKNERPDLFLRQELSTLFRNSRSLFALPSVAFFLLAYFLFNDALTTAANNFSIFLEQVWHVSDLIKTYIMLSILVTSAIGGVVSGWIADRFGHKRTLLCILAGWVVLLPLVGLITNFTAFVVATTFMGFWFGANWAVSRSVMAYVAPPGQHNLAFAYFGLAERASSLLGPLAWGLVVSGIWIEGAARYRLAMVVITVFIVLGLFSLRRVKNDRA